MHVLTRGRDGLKRQGVAVAGDLITRQQSIIKQYRNDGYNQDLRTGVRTTLGVEVAGATGIGPRRPQATAVWHRGVLLVGILLTSLLRLLVESQTQLQMELTQCQVCLLVIVLSLSLRRQETLTPCLTAREEAKARWSTSYWQWHHMW